MCLFSPDTDLAQIATLGGSWGYILMGFTVNSHGMMMRVAVWWSARLGSGAEGVAGVECDVRR